MSHQQSSQLPSLFQNVAAFSQPFPPLGQTIPDLYREAFAANSSSTTTTHSLFLPSIFSVQPQTSMLPPLHNNFYGNGATTGLMDSVVPTGPPRPAPSLSSAFINASDKNANVQPSEVGMATTLHSQANRLFMSNLTNQFPVGGTPGEKGSLIPTNWSHLNLNVVNPCRSTSSMDVAPYDKTRFTPPCGPLSHGEPNSSASDASPLSGPTPSPLGCRQLRNSRTPSLTGQSPGAADLSPSSSSADVVNQKKQSKSPMKSFVPSAAAELQQTSTNIQSTSMLSSNFGGSLSSSSSTASITRSTSNISRATLPTLSHTPSISHFDPSELEQNGFFTNNVDPSLTTAVDEALSALGRDVNLDLDSIAPNHQFWEDLGDSVLDDALLGSSASVDDSSLVGTSLLHSVFEFSSLQNSSFHDLVSPSSSNLNCSFVEPATPNMSRAIGASANGATITDSSSTPKLQENINQIAEIDRAFARHLNMIVEKNEGSSNDVFSAETANFGSSSSVVNSFAVYSSDLSYLVSSGEEAKREVSPVRFSPVAEIDVDELPSISSHISRAVSMFIPISAEEAAADLVDQSPSTSYNVPKCFARKSKKVPIYKQSAPTATKTCPTVKKVNQSFDSPYSFTDDEEEAEATISKPETNVVQVKTEIPAHEVDIKDRLVEEEVHRKLLQISSLHPELRLATAKETSKNLKSTVLSMNVGLHKSLTNNLQLATNEQKISTTARATTSSEPLSDLLRHVVPKKRLSVSSRGSVGCKAMTPPKCATSTFVQETSSKMQHVPLVNRAWSNVETTHVDAFVKTEVIADTDTAKPFNKSAKFGCLNADNKLNNRKANSVNDESAKPLEQLKPKLIIRIPKQCLLNLHLNEMSNEDDGDSGVASPHKHKRKHKHKKKRRKERQSLDVDFCERNRKDEKKKRRNSDFVSTPYLNGDKVESTSKRKRLMISSDSDGCRSSFSGDDASNTFSNELYRNRTESKLNCVVENVNEAASTKNRKKQRWLHSQADFNSDPATATTDTVGQQCSFTNGNLTTSCYLTDAAEKPLISQTAVFQKGAFVVCKEDIAKPDCPLWKVDSQNLLQKFVPIEKDGKIVYQGSSTYAGWCIQNQEKYVAVQVKFLHFTRIECVVELESLLLDLFPAISTEITESFEISETDSTNERGSCLSSTNFTHPLKEALQNYVHVLLVHCVLGNYLQSLRQRNEMDVLRQMNEVDIINFEKKKKISNEVNWTKKFEEALEWYPFCTLNEDDGLGLHCQACERNVVENVLQLFANEGYDFDTLEARPPKTTVSGSPLPSQDFHLCPSCADIAVLYHKLIHMRYHLFKKCSDKVDLIRGDNCSMDATSIIEQCLKNKNWILFALQEYLNIWSKIN